MLNRFCLLSKKSCPPHPCSLQTIPSSLEYQPELNEKYMPFLYYISSSDGTSYKHFYDTATSSFISCYFTLAFYISRYYFSQIFGTSVNSTNTIYKKIFVTKFYFFNRFILTIITCNKHVP